MLLSKVNAHPRDEFITFEEGPHIYTVHGEQGYTSVTTWNHHHFPVFDSDKIVDGMLRSKKIKEVSHKYYGFTKQQILDDWDKNRDEAAKAGTKMHYDIECYYNGLAVVNESIEYSYFQKFVQDFPNLKPYRTEWMVYWEEIKISGSIDMVFENENGELLIYDWKRCKEISFENGFGKNAITPCISHLPDSNFWHYSLQLNMYKKILENKYDKKVVGLFLICLHPDNPYKTYDRIEVNVLDTEMNDLLEVRRKEVEMMKKTDTSIVH